MKWLVFSTVVCGVVLSSARTSHGACLGDATTIVQLLTSSSSGEQAFADMNLTALLKHTSQAREEVLPCLKQPLEPKQVAAFLRLMAMESFTRKNLNQVISEFHGARMLDPGYQIPPEVADGDHPLLVQYEKSAQAPDGLPEVIYAPEGGYVVVNGVRNAPRLSHIPVIIQVYGSKGEWIETQYIQPGDKLPQWGRNVFGMTASDLGIEVDTQPGWQDPLPWYISGGVTGGLAILFYALAMSEKAQFENLETSESDLSGHRDRANGFSITSAVTAGLALGLSGVGIGFQFGFGEDEDVSMVPSEFLPLSIERSLMADVGEFR